MKPLRALHLSLVFLTRLPLPSLGVVEPAGLARASAAFPLVGALVGALGAAAFDLAHHVLPPGLSALAALGVTLLATGALHEDGFADFADGCGGGADRARALEIMRDSRIGSYGALALMMSVGLRALALASLAAPLRVAGALVAAHVLGRAVLPAVMRLLPPARSDGLGAGAGRPAAVEAALAAALGAVLAVLALGGARGLGALAAAVLAAGGMALMAKRRLGGFTGDVLGAIEQAVEIAVLLAVVGMA